MRCEFAGEVRYSPALCCICKISKSYCGHVYYCRDIKGLKNTDNYATCPLRTKNLGQINSEEKEGKE